MQKTNIIPSMRYRDAPAAIEWLCKVFGFRKHLVVPGESGAIAHAQLVLGNGMIMLGSDTGDEYGRTVSPPGKDGINTQSCYIVIKELDDHYAHTVASGAEIVMKIADQDYGGRLYSVRDPEGHLWNFGSYDPWNGVEESLSLEEARALRGSGWDGDLEAMRSGRMP